MAHFPNGKAFATLSIMESSSTPPTRAQASAALAEAEATRAQVAGDVVLPSGFTASMGAAVAVQIGTTAVAVGGGPLWVLAAGLVIFTVVAGVQLLRFRRRNGVRLGGLADRVVFGSGAVASWSYAAGFVVAIAAANAGRWWLVVLASLLAGAGYALAGRRWMTAYRAAPHEHARGTSAAWLAASAIATIAGVLLLVLLR